jgi:hypothetical protein
LCLKKVDCRLTSYKNDSNQEDNKVLVEVSVLGLDVNILPNDVAWLFSWLQDLPFILQNESLSCFLMVNWGLSEECLSSFHVVDAPLEDLLCAESNKSSDWSPVFFIVFIHYINYFFLSLYSLLLVVVKVVVTTLNKFIDDISVVVCDEYSTDFSLGPFQAFSFVQAIQLRYHLFLEVLFEASL